MNYVFKVFKFDSIRMKKKWVNACQRTIMALCFCSLGAPCLYAQQVYVDPVFETKADSLKKEYLRMGVEEETAEQRARGVIESEQPENRLRQGNLNNNPNSGSIHVNRNPTYRAYTPTQLVEEIFVKGGACSSVGNVTLKSHGWNGTRWTNNDNRGLGYFHRGASVFEMEEGLALSTGGLVSIEGSNNGSNSVAPPPSSANTTDSDLS